MVRLQPGNSSSTFRLNGKPYQKGAYELVINGNYVGVSRLSDYLTIIAPQNYTQWTDAGGIPYASLAALQADLEEIFFLNNGALNFSFAANTYNDLIALAPTASMGSLAYVYNSQGTAWLPGTLGGTYYPDGIYFYTGTGWVSSRNAIAGELQSLIDSVAAKADSTDPRFPATNEKQALAGTSGIPSSANKYVTDQDPRNSNARTPTAHTHPISDVVGLQTALDGKLPMCLNSQIWQHFRPLVKPGRSTWPMTPV